MEANLAAEGNVEELRRWLQQHPDRVNAPVRPGGYTLLYHVLMGLSKSNVALLLQGRPNKFDETMRMLCEEFHADADAPNGGEGNTAVHFAVELGDLYALRYLIDGGRSKLLPNRYGESPLEFGRRKRPGSDCVLLLQRKSDSMKQHEAQTERLLKEDQELYSLRERLDLLRLKDSSDDEAQPSPRTAETGGGGAPSALPPTHPNGGVGGVGGGSASSSSNHLSSAAPVALPSDSNSPSISTIAFGGGGGGGGGSPLVSAQPPVVLRLERDISHERVFDNGELEEFRATFGNGFTYLKCRSHYEVRGLLPYKFKENEYFTPVILCMYSPQRQTPQLQRPTASSPGAAASTAAAASSSSPVEASRSTVAGPDGDPNWKVSYSRYRALLDFAHMNDFAVSRKAEYIEPLSGAIMPSSGDAATCRSLVEFVRTCVIANFERVAPMVTKASAYAFDGMPSLAVLEGPADVFRHHHSSGAPSYMRCVLKKRDSQRVWAYRVLQDLSRFGDGLFQFDLGTRTASGVIPIVLQRSSDREVLVLTTSPNSRLAGSSPAGGGRPTREEGGASSPTTTATTTTAADVHTTSSTRPIDAEVIFSVRTVVCLPKAAEGFPPPPPMVYLPDCCDPATRPPSHRGGDGGRAIGRFVRRYAVANYHCFGSLLSDTATGLVKEEVLQPCRGAWLLSQQAAWAKASEKDRRRKEGGGGGGGGAAVGAVGAPSSANGELCDVLLLLQAKLTAALEAFADGYHRSTAGSAGAHRPLDAFFGDGNSEPTACEGSGRRCVICFNESKSAVLQPCRHAVCCANCAQRLANHVRGGGFHCPVCRRKVDAVQEVYL